MLIVSDSTNTYKSTVISEATTEPCSSLQRPANRNCPRRSSHHMRPLTCVTTRGYGWFAKRNPRSDMIWWSKGFWQDTSSNVSVAMCAHWFNHPPFNKIKTNIPPFTVTEILQTWLQTASHRSVFREPWSVLNGSPGRRDATDASQERTSWKAPPRIKGKLFWFHFRVLLRTTILDASLTCCRIHAKEWMCSSDLRVTLLRSQK